MTATGEAFVITARPKPGIKLSEDQLEEISEELQSEMIEETGFVWINPRIVRFWHEVNAVTGLVTAFHAWIEHDGPRVADA